MNKLFLYQFANKYIGSPFDFALRASLPTSPRLRRTSRVTGGRNKLFLSILFSFISVNSFYAMDHKEVMLNDEKISYDLVLKTIKNLKCLLQTKPAIFYKMVQRCHSNSSKKNNESGCHKYDCPKDGRIVSRCGLNFHEYNVCRIIVSCVKIDGINYEITDPFNQQDDVEEGEEVWV